MERRIPKKFQELKNRGAKAFIPFIMAGDPDLETTVRLVPEMERAGSHIIELGIPFSDPIADGPVIQRAGLRALAHRYRMSDYLAAVKDVREKSEVPLLMFSYFNPIFQYGLESLARDARAVGVDGILVTDIIPEEAAHYCAVLGQNELDSIFLAAPTSGNDRLARIAGCSTGFVYVVSRAGVTGTQEHLSDSILSTVQRVRGHTQLPVVVGFGISTPEQVKAVWEISDGAVVGSAIVTQMENCPAQEIPVRIGKFCRWLIGEGA